LDHTIKYWDRTQTPIKAPHRFSVSAVASMGNVAISADRGGMILVWRAGAVVTSAHGHQVGWMEDNLVSYSRSACYQWMCICLGQRQRVCLCHCC
jgi:hypothetical protein